VPERIFEIKYDDFFAITAIVLIVWFSGVSAFVVGVMISLPNPVSKIVNTQSVAHLGAQLTFMIAVWWVVYKISRAIVLGSFSIFLVARTKFSIVNRYPDGYRDPVVARWQRRKLNELIYGSELVIRFSQLIISVFTIVALFFYRGERGSFDSMPWLEINAAFFFALAAIFAFMFAHQAPIRFSHWDVVKSRNGVPFFGAILLLVFVYLGIHYSLGVSASQPFYLETDFGLCELSPMFPVFGGQLFFEHLSGGYIVIGGEGNILALQGANKSMIADCASDFNN